MSLSLEIINNIIGYSCAKYSTWFYYRPDHVLFDAGEGVSLAMRNTIYGINYIFLSHSHGDHIDGLPGLIRSRASSMGDTTKALTIYYPKNDALILQFKEYLKQSIFKLPYQLTWTPLEPGDRVNLNGNRFIEAFASDHTNSLSLGYKIVESRKRLKEKYRELSQKELIFIIKKYGQKEINEMYEKNLLVYTGDTMPIDTDVMKNAEVLLHDATFANKNDREENTHATVDEACQVALKANVSALALFHFSSRYNRQQIKNEIRKCIEQYNMSIPIFYTLPPFHSNEFKKV